MITRVLPPEEWPRLVGTEAEGLWPLLDPENARVIVVEDEGRIVGTWTLMRVVHAECIWIAPEYRGRVGVVKRLLRGLHDLAAVWGAAKVVTGSVSGHVTDLILRFGGQPLPYVAFVLPTELPARRVREQEALCR